MNSESDPKKTVTNEPTHSSSKVVFISGIIHRYVSNLNEDWCPASLTSSVTSRVVKSWPEELLKTKAADFGQKRHELNKLKSENVLSRARIVFGFLQVRNTPCSISLQLQR